MKVFGITISRDYEEAKDWRREALKDKKNIEFLIEHGNMGTLKRKFVWRLDGAHFPLYNWYLYKILYSAVHILWIRLINRLSRING